MSLQALPAAVADAIAKTARTPAERRKLAAVAGYLFRKYLYDGIPFDEVLDVSAEHFRGQVGTHYLPALQTLKAAGIVAAVKNTDGRETYHAGQHGRLGRCKRYFFAEGLVYTDPVLIERTEAAKRRFSPDVLPTVKILQRLKLAAPAKRLPAVAAKLITPDGIAAKMAVGDAIPAGAYPWAYASRRTGETVRHGATPLPVKAINELAERERADLVLWAGRVYVCDAKTFAKRRELEARASLLNSLAKLKEIRDRRNIYCSRNETNGRLDHNLTNLKSAALPLLRLDGEPLAQIDLKNSQFTILAELIACFIDFCATGRISEKLNIIEVNRTANGYPKLRDVHILFNRLFLKISPINVTQKAAREGEKRELSASFVSSCERFIFLTKRGQFYEALAADMGAKWGRKVSRGEAKGAMFRACFSSHRHIDPAKQVLREILPGPVLFMDAFKQVAAEMYRAEGLAKREAADRGKASLAIALQTIEAAIFVDTILPRLHSEGISALTKHDSVLYKPSDRAAVLRAATAALDAFFGQGGYVLDPS
jgi:hypothetical protein